MAVSWRDDTPGSEGGERSPSYRASLHILVLFLFAMAVRLAALPHAGADSLDNALRVWVAERWLADPFFFLHGVWPPLHFYMIAGAIQATGDTILAPTLMHLLLGCLIPPLLYAFTRHEFATEHGALVVGAIAALYPVAVLNSLSPRAETPFIVALVIAMLLLAHSRRRPAAADWHFLAGLALSIGAGFRHEAWLIAPFLAVVLLPRFRNTLLMLLGAAIGPATLMAANWQIYGDPLWGVSVASQGELLGMGRADLSMGDLVSGLILFESRVLWGLTPLVAIAALLGMVQCLASRDRSLVWLVPILGLTALLGYAILRGSLVPKLNYTIVFGVLILPFIAALIRTARFRNLSFTASLAIWSLLLGSLAAFTLIGAMRDIGDLRNRFAVLAAVPAVDVVPRVPDQERLDTLQPSLAALLDDPQEGLIIDFLGFPGTGYVALRTGIGRDRIFITDLLRNVDLDAQADETDLRYRPFPLIGNRPAALTAFLETYPQGALVLQEGSRFAEWLGYAPGETSLREDLGLEIREQARVPRTLPDDPAWLAAGETPGAPASVVVLSYARAANRP